MKRKSIRRYQEEFAGSRLGAVIVWKLADPFIKFLLCIAACVMVPIGAMAHVQAMTNGVMNTGASPASMMTSNLPQSTVIQYDKKFIKNLKANTPGVRCCSRRQIDSNSGNQLQLFMYNTLGANTAQVAEGTVGSGITVSVSSNLSTIGQFSDYVNISDLAMETAIDPALENIQKELAYRLGLTLTTLVLRTADGAAAVDGTVDDLSLPAAVPFGKSVITTAVSSMAGRNIMPFDRGRYTGMIHSFQVGDTLNDNTNNSLTDCLKRSPEGLEMLKELPSPDGDQIPVLEWAGVSFHQTTLVTATANYLGSGSTALRTYIIGEDGLIAISLGKQGNAQLKDGDYRNLQLWMMKAGGPSPSDPARMIGGWTSYNVKFVVTLPPDTVQRLRFIDSVSAIT
jgi:hypothetical protein